MGENKGKEGLGWMGQAKVWRRQSGGKSSSHETKTSVGTHKQKMFGRK